MFELVFKYVRKENLHFFKVLTFNFSIRRYLVPCTHLMVSQASHVTDVDHYGRSAEKFLSLIPRCCATLLNNDHLSSASSAGSLETIEDYYSKDDRQNDTRSRSSSSATSNVGQSNGESKKFVFSVF